MPVVNLENRGLEGGVASLGPVDVVVVGTGPAGSTIARELSGTHLKVVLLESGSRVRQTSADRLNAVENVGHPREPDQWNVRNRILGGSSHTWGGRCTPFDQEDFVTRPWVTDSGWPITADALQPFLERSATHLGLAIGDHYNDDRFWRLAGRERPPENPDPDFLMPFFWQFSRDFTETYPYEYMRFGRHLERTIGENVTLVLGATVVQLDPAPSGDIIRSVTIADPDGLRSTLEANTVVLACGGIENARLLLASRAVASKGLGNDRDLVGRYLMDHPRGVAGVFDLKGSEYLQKRFGRYQLEGHLFRAGFRLSPKLQQEEELLNCTSWLGEDISVDDPWAALRRMMSGKTEFTRDAASLIRNLPFLARGARDYVLERNGIPRRLSGLNLVAMVEQRPDRNSRISLSDELDAFGVPLPQIDWRVSPQEARTVRRMAQITARQLRQMGLPSPQLPHWVLDGLDLPPDWLDVAHPTGTTRMARSERLGVVDANGQAFGVEGLYIAGSSVFPTSGHGNPTQLIVALAVRLADHLRLTQRRDRVEIAADRQTTVVLTGARGRIGRVVLEDLLDRGYCVRAVASSTEERVPRSNLSWHQVDMSMASTHEYDTVLHGADAVIHLAAEIGLEDRMLQVNVVATKALARASERAGVQAFVYTSTISVYGSAMSRVAREDGPVLSLDRDVPGEYLALPYVRTYGRTKLMGEMVLRDIAQQMRVEILRPAVVVDIPDLINIREWSASKRIFAAHRHSHHVYVRDVSDALIWSMERAMAATALPGRVEVFNVAEDEAVGATHASFLQRAFRRTGDRRFHVIAVPGLIDWVHDIARFRVISLRNPLWRMRFPVSRLLAAGWIHPFGMAYAQRVALDRLLVAATSELAPASPASAEATSDS